MLVKKRTGELQKFNEEKILSAIKKCDYSNTISDFEISCIMDDIVEMCKSRRSPLNIEYIQDSVINTLKAYKFSELALRYEEYRKDMSDRRLRDTELMNSIKALGGEMDKDNANIGNSSAGKMLGIGSVSNRTFNLLEMPKRLRKAHQQELYYHDLDYFNLTINCLHVPVKRLLREGFSNGTGTINKPKRIESASELMCILLDSTQNEMYGGQSNPDLEGSLGEYVGLTRCEIITQYKEDGFDISEENIKKRLKKRVSQSMQAIIYNLNFLHSRAGNQCVFSSVNIGLPMNEDEALITECFLNEYYKGLGKGESPLFPSVIFRCKKGINQKGDKYYYLYKLACKVAAKRMNPTFLNLDSPNYIHYYNKGYIPALMGCRTGVLSNINGEPGVDGRGNIAPTTINLPRLGILANHDIDKFFELFSKNIKLVDELLLYIKKVLRKLKAKDLPFIASGILKGSENLKPDESIEPILKQGTYAIGFIGLAECLVALTGKHHGESKKSQELGLRIIKFLREQTDKFTNEYKLNFSTYATPSEGLCYKFLDSDKKKFGIIKGVTDKGYYTNSSHVPVGFSISAKDKIDIESEYHQYCNGGFILYVELDGKPDPEVIESLTEYAFTKTKTGYIAYNFQIRYCKDCGEELNINQDSCPKCGSLNIENIARITGYLAPLNRFGKGKSEEIKERKSTQNKKVNYRQ